MPQSTHLENGDNGSEEGSACLNNELKQKTQIRRARDWVIGDSKLSERAKIAVWSLLVVCLILLSSVIALAVCWPTGDHHSACLSPECLRVAAELMQHMDETADKCTAARQWSCGGWIEDNSHQLPARSAWSVLDDVNLQELRRLRDVITTTSNLVAADTLELKLKILYESCMAVDMIESDGYKRLNDIIQEIGGWHARREWSQLTWSWRDSLERLQSLHGIAPLFSVTLAWRGNTSALHLQPDGFGMPHPTFYMLPPDSKPVKAYMGLLKDVALTLNVPTPAAGRFAQEVFNFERRLAELLQGDNEYKAYTQTWMTMSDFNTSHLQFQSILHEMFPDVPLKADTDVLVTAPHYIGYLNNIVTGTSTSILNNYFTWTLIRKYLPYMSKDFRLIWKVYESHVTGSSIELSRWEFCADLLRQSAPLATQALVETQTRTDSLEVTAAHEIFEAIKRQSIEDIVASTNLTGDMKSVMIGQVNAMQLQIGLKPVQKSHPFLQNYYNDLLKAQKHDFFNSIRFTVEAQIKFLRRSFADQDFAAITDIAKSLTLTEATYNRHIHAVVLPTSLISKPYFDAAYPRSVLFGRIGATLGTAVARALTLERPDTNIKHPKYAAATVQCLSRNMNDTASKPMAISTSAYVRIVGATLALKASRNSNNTYSALPVVSLYGDKLFTATYAQTLCAIHSPEQAVLDGINSRLNGETTFTFVWSHIHEIQHTLGCPQAKQCPASL